jgi:hypothetical protein
MSRTALIDKLPALLSVDNSYKAVVIPQLVDNSIRRLLRDYNFSQTFARLQFPIIAGEVSYQLPAGFKKDLMVVLYQAPDLYGEPLLKREGIVARGGNGAPMYYWIEADKLWLNSAFLTTEPGCFVTLFYQSMSVAANADWLCAAFEDVVLSLTMYRAASVLRKPELAQAWGPIWAEDQRSIAIYLNELEWDHSEIIGNESRNYSTTNLRYGTREG